MVVRPPATPAFAPRVHPIVNASVPEYIRYKYLNTNAAGSFIKVVKGHTRACERLNFHTYEEWVLPLNKMFSNYIKR